MQAFKSGFCGCFGIFVALNVVVLLGFLVWMFTSH